MAVQPIDLQTLFTQLDKIGKNQASQREGLAIQQALQGIQVQKETEAHIQSVNESQNTGDGVDAVKERGARKRPDEDTEDQDDGQTSEEEGENKPRGISIIRDPALGRNIDFSG